MIRERTALHLAALSGDVRVVGEDIEAKCKKYKETA